MKPQEDPFPRRQVTHDQVPEALCSEEQINWIMDLPITVHVYEVHHQMRMDMECRWLLTMRHNDGGKVERMGVYVGFDTGRAALAFNILQRDGTELDGVYYIPLEALIDIEHVPLEQHSPSRARPPPTPQLTPSRALYPSEIRGRESYVPKAGSKPTSLDALDDLRTMPATTEKRLGLLTVRTAFLLDITEEDAAYITECEPTSEPVKEGGSLCQHVAEWDLHAARPRAHASPAGARFILPSLTNKVQKL